MNRKKSTNTAKQKKAQEMFRALERPFHNLIESLRTGVYMADSQGNLIFANQAYAQMIGYKDKNEILGLNLARELYASPKDREVFLQRIEERGYVRDYEVKNIRKDGKVITLSVTSNFIKDADGRIVGTEGIVRDITVQKETEEALNRINEFNRTILDTIPFGMDIVDSDGNILFLDKKLQALFGRNAVGKKCWELYKDDREQCEFCPLKHGVQIGETASLETRGAFGGRVFEITHTGMLYEGKKAILEIFQDVTERRKVEEALRESEEKFRQFFENEPEYCYMVSLEGKILDMNAAALQRLGYKKKEIIGKPLLTSVYAPSSRPKAKRLFAKWKKTGRLRNEELIIMSKKGEERTVLLSVDAMKDTEGKPLHSISVQRDITERKKAEEELRKLQEDLKFEKRKLEQVLGIDQRISSILELNQLVDFVIDKSSDILEAERCSLMMLEPKSQELLIKGAKGLTEEIIKKTRVKVGEQISGIVAKEGKPLLVMNIESEHPIARRSKPSYKSKSFVSVPIKLHNRVVGVVNITDKSIKDDNVFNQIDLRILCTIVRQAAIAIENANYYRELEFLSTIDPLTGLFNHRYFVQTLDCEINRAKRYPKPLCLMMADIDNLKFYNDTYGHLEGDHLLKAVSRALKEKLRAVDIVCRYAGDEFVAILPETDIPQARVIAEKVKHAVEGLQLKSTVSVSIGMARRGKDTDRRDLVMKADQALYQAKRAGKDRIYCLS